MLNLAFRSLVALLITLLALIGVLLAAANAAPSNGAIVFQQFRQGGGQSFVYVDPFRGLHIRTQTAMHIETAYENLAYSPDRSLYILPRPSSTGVDLFLYTQGRESELQLTHGTAFPPTVRGMRSNTYPVWSPRGDWVAFLSTNMSATMDVFIIRPDGSGLRRVAQDIGTITPPRLRWTTLNIEPLLIGDWLLLVCLSGVGLLSAILYSSRGMNSPA